MVESAIRGVEKSRDRRKLMVRANHSSMLRGLAPERRRRGGLATMAAYGISEVAQ